MARKTSLTPVITDELERLVIASMAWYDEQEARHLKRVWVAVNDRGIACSKNFEFLMNKGIDYLVSRSSTGDNLVNDFSSFLMATVEGETNPDRREELKSYLATINYDGSFLLADDIRKRFEWEATKSYLTSLENSGADLNTLFSTRPITLGTMSDDEDDDRAPKSLSEIEDEEENNNYFNVGVGADVAPVAGNFLVFAARPGVGKSLAMLNMACKNAIDGDKCLFISLEMTDKQLKTRMVKHIAAIEGCSSTTRAVSKTNSWKAIDKNLMIWVPDSHSAEIVLGNAIDIIKQNNIKVVFIDYLQLLKYSTAKDEWASIRQLTFELKQLALQQSVLICSASQVSRSSTETSLDLTSMFGSSSIESDTDIVIGLECNTKKRFKNSTTPVNVRVLKNRQGALSETTVMIDYSTGMIESQTQWSEEQEQQEDNGQQESAWESATEKF